MSSINTRQLARQKQAQTLQLSPQLVQAIGLLNLPHDELEAYLEDKALENPFLRVRRDTSFRSGPVAGASMSEIIEATHAAENSLVDSLCAQLRAMQLAPAIERHALELAHEVDEAGYLPGGDAGIETGPALIALQACEPTGVGARDLVECLELQLTASGWMSHAWIALLDNLPALAQKRTDILLRACGVDEAELAEMIATLRRLDPKPGLAFETAEISPRTPDAGVRQGRDGSWEIVLTADDTIHVAIDTEAADSIRNRAWSEDDIAYVQRQIDEANWLTDSLRRRSETLIKVISAICAVQHDAILHGLEKLRPLSMQTIAERIGVHESTVSRCVSGKTIATPRGLVVLRDLFAEAVDTSDERLITHHEVEAEITRLIASEAASSPLSDEALREALDRAGIRVARRTVTKYRERLGCPASHLRKRSREFAERLGV